MEVVGGVSSLSASSPAPARARLRQLSPGEASGGGSFLLVRTAPRSRLQAAARPARRAALVVEARGRGWSDRRSQQQRMPQLPKIEDDGNPRFVIFIRTANVYFWYPLNIVTGGTTAKIMLAAKDNFLGKYIYKDTLARNLAAVIYKDEDDIIDTAKEQYRVLKTDNEFRYGYKVVENGNLRSALTTSNVIELPKKEELKTVVDKVKDFFGDVTSGAKESFAQITGSVSAEAEAPVEEEKPWVKRRNERKRKQKEKQNQKQGISSEQKELRLVLFCNSFENSMSSI
uniref:Protein HHL1, chloroplastic n=1 Tax=Oryza meridionalis TaxID=40149 RepID=A0A0E0CMX8_9ORYZ